MCGVFFILNPFLFILRFNTHTWKLDQEVRALACMMFNENGSLVIFDNTVRDGETQASSRSNLFRSEEWIKDALFQFWRDTRAGIAKTQIDALVLQRTRDANFFTKYIRQCVSRVGQQVNEDLFHLNGIANHDDLFFRKMELHFN